MYSGAYRNSTDTSAEPTWPISGQVRSMRTSTVTSAPTTTNATTASRQARAGVPAWVTAPGTWPGWVVAPGTASVTAPGAASGGAAGESDGRVTAANRTRFPAGFRA